MIGNLVKPTKATKGKPVTQLVVGSYRNDSATRSIAGYLRFLTFTQCFDRPGLGCLCVRCVGARSRSKLAKQTSNARADFSRNALEKFQQFFSNLFGNHWTNLNRGIDNVGASTSKQRACEARENPV